jgi:hypothetical protein
MNTLLDNSLVGVALLVSAGYAIARLGPRSLKKRGLESLSRWLAGAPSFLRLGRVSRGLAAAAAGKAQAACGGCDNCATESAPAPPLASAQSSAEIKVPVANIGRRA